MFRPTAALLLLAATPAHAQTTPEAAPQAKPAADIQTVEVRASASFYPRGKVK